MQGGYGPADVRRRIAEEQPAKVREGLIRPHVLTHWMQRFVPCAVAALAMLPLFLAAPARAQPVSLTVELAEYSLSPNGIEVALGEQVQILVINNGSLGHTFVIESYANYDTNITPGAQTNVFFTADAAGTYAMYCVLPGHRNLGMEGTLTIRRVVATPPTPVLEVVGILAATAVAAVAIVVLLRSRRDSQT